MAHKYIFFLFVPQSSRIADLEEYQINLMIHVALQSNSVVQSFPKTETIASLKQEIPSFFF